MIKFRAWDKKTQRWIKPSFDGDILVGDHSVVAKHWKPNRGYYVFDKYETLDDDNVIVMQYTTLNDKNSKEIYVGDIVRLRGDNENLFIIEFSLGSFVLCSDFSEDYIIGNIKTNYIEIVGNIYENPELLEKVKKI